MRYLTPEYREPKPPEWWPLGKYQQFYDLSFKLQMFIFLKYREHRPKRWIMKYMFIKTDNTYYKYDHKASKFVSDILN